MKTITKKLVGSEEERAVSPVIGVILMVAITVILAAVIAAFVLDIGPGDTDPIATFDLDNADENGNDVEVTLNSLGSGTDGIVVVDSTENGAIDEEEVLTVSGQSQEYPVDDSVLIAYSGDVDDETDDVGDLDNIAIIDNLEEYEDD